MFFFIPVFVTSCSDPSSIGDSKVTSSDAEAEDSTIGNDAANNNLPQNNDAALSSLSLSGGGVLSSVFSPTNLSYTVLVPSGVTTIDLIAAMSGSGTITYNGASSNTIDLSGLSVGGTQVVLIKTTAPDGTSMTYTLNINRSAEVVQNGVKQIKYLISENYSTGWLLDSGGRKNFGVYLRFDETCNGINVDSFITRLNLLNSESAYNQIVGVIFNFASVCQVQQSVLAKSAGYEVILSYNSWPQTTPSFASGIELNMVNLQLSGAQFTQLQNFSYFKSKLSGALNIDGFIPTNDSACKLKYFEADVGGSFLFTNSNMAKCNSLKKISILAAGDVISTNSLYFKPQDLTMFEMKGASESWNNYGELVSAIAIPTECVRTTVSNTIEIKCNWQTTP